MEGTKDRSAGLLDRTDDEARLQELDPSPVEESYEFIPDPNSEEAAKESPRPRQSGSVSSLLGLHEHSATWYLTRIQKFSSYTFGAFTAMHMANTSLIPLLTRSVPASEPYLLLTRPYYQSVVAEPLLVVAPLVAHVSSGVALRLLRRRQNLKRYGAESRNDRRLVAWPSLSGTSLAGLVLVPLVVGHAYLNRLLPLIVEGGSSIVGLQYVSHGFAKHPIVSNVGFSLLVGTAAGHFVWGSSRWMGFHPDSIPGARSYGEQRAKRRRYLLHAITAAVAALWLSGGLGVVGRAGELAGWLGREYDHIYSQIPLIGHML